MQSVTMHARGAPLVCATAACEVALAMCADPGDANPDSCLARLPEARPTAVNLVWALRRMQMQLRAVPVALTGELQ